MTKECPSCHQNIEVLEANFGSLYTCSSCSAVYFINFDGDPESSDLQVEVHDAMSMDMNSSSRQFGDNLNEDSVSATEDSINSEDINIYEQTGDDQSLEQTASDNEVTNEDTAQLSSEGHGQSYSEAIDDSQSSAKQASNPLQEINDFANATDSNLTGLKYRVILQGIDSKILLQEVKEALEDARFNWDVGIILSQRKNGKIELSSLPPVKAMLIIQRLRLSGLDFIWEEVND